MAGDAPLEIGPGDLFATTRWTVIVTARGRHTPAAERALQELCSAYWYPLYAYVRRQGHGREDAEDLTQAFFARMLAGRDLDRLDSEKGRFRAFLLAAMKHFLANEWDKVRAQKRGGGAVHLPLDWHEADARYGITSADESSPDRIYDRAWAVTLLERVIGKLRRECEAEGRVETFDVLRDFLMLQKEAIPYAQAGEQLGLTPGAVRVAVHRLRKRYRELLREEISQTVSDTGQIEEEMRALFQAFAAS